MLKAKMLSPMRLLLLALNLLPLKRKHAKHPQPFCHYHLTILWSYKSGHRSGKNNQAEAVLDSTANRSSSSSTMKRTWKEARASATANPNSIIYYASFAPGRGKRRCGMSDFKIKEDEGSTSHHVPGFDVLVYDDDSYEHLCIVFIIVIIVYEYIKSWNLTTCASFFICLNFNLRRSASPLPSPLREAAIENCHFKDTNFSQGQCGLVFNPKQPAW